MGRTGDSCPDYIPGRIFTSVNGHRACDGARLLGERRAARGRSFPGLHQIHDARSVGGGLSQHRLRPNVATQSHSPAILSRITFIGSGFRERSAILSRTRFLNTCESVLADGYLLVKRCKTRRPGNVFSHSSDSKVLVDQLLPAMRLAGRRNEHSARGTPSLQARKRRMLRFVLVHLIPQELPETTGVLKVDLELAKPLMVLVG